jgi:hypothetical protein
MGQGGTRAYGFRGRLEVATMWPCLVIDSGGRSILLSLNPRAAPKVKDAILGSDICHAFSHFYPRLGEDLKQTFEVSKLSL